MLRYFLKRLGLALVTVAVIITITFWTMNAVPGEPFEREKAPEPKVKAVLEARFGLDKPVSQQFVMYVGNILKGNFGISLKSGREITTTIRTGFATSAMLGAMAIVVALTFGLIFGMIAALFRNRWPGRVIIFFTTLFVSVPSFVLATLLLLTFSITLSWVPVWSASSRHLLLPVIALALYPMSYITRLTKSNLLDILGQDYIRTARAKGVRGWLVIVKHALRNALIPIITYLGPLTAYILTGSLVVETIFTIGGLGGEFVKAILQRDYPLIMGTTIFLSIIMIAMTLLSDIVYRVVDPRITFN